ncbi:hypothetical protein E2986_08822 [Frieseomelitta varia]|uniref:GDP-fucose protein O-fucosyltransferase 1 n=1 Tax=Frieseomelitta varia TaxID=561572 RepID=A0A833SJ53_9HYME|nr:hypothetical protein E2986_08822 [Frieseomelitta varia]
MFSIIFILLTRFYSTYCEDFDIDTNGYIVYCPCMGRFGNQADHFLGALGFAKALNRTLIIPPWVEYRTGETKSIQVPFDTYFNVSKIQSYHKALLMEDFMQDIAPRVWQPKERVCKFWMSTFCYSARGKGDSCNAKDGNPFGPFWDTYNIDFVKSEFYGPLHYDVYHTDMAMQWKKQYPALHWPVLAFTGAPASFPVQLENKRLQKYVEWNTDMFNKAVTFIKQKLPRGAFVRACEFISSTPNLFAAPQCLGYRNERGKATSAMCLPSFDLVIRHLKRVIRNGNDIKSVFVASDNNYMIEELTKALARMKRSFTNAQYVLQVPVFKQDSPASPHLDLAILGRANYFIGNCISSFSAFVAREREIKGYPTFFWGFPSERSSSSITHEEL